MCHNVFRIHDYWLAMLTVRPARVAEKDQLNALIRRSGLGLAQGFYTDEQAAAITTEVYGVDSALVADGTFFVIDNDGEMVACGGWSKRATDFGGDHAKRGADRPLDPSCEPARIRAFFVAPDMARRGLGSLLLEHCTEQARAAGFTSLELVSTMPGEPFYVQHGFALLEPIALPLSGGVTVALTRMRKSIA